MKKTRSLQQKKELKTNVILVLVSLCIVLGLFFISKYRTENHFAYEKALDEVVFSYKDGEVILRELSYYIMLEEATVNEHAIEYDENNPLSYWNLHVEGGYVSDDALEAALNYCIRDVLYAKYAKENGITISLEKEEDLRSNAKGIVGNLTEKQASTGITEEDIYQALCNNYLADQWVMKLAKKEGITFSEKVLSAYYGMNSYYYKDMLVEMEVEVNEKLLGQLNMGRITVN